MRRWLWMIVFLGLVVAACGKDQIKSNMSGEIDHFEFTTQDEQSLGLDDLKGEWWIADFMYTNCTIVCPTMTANMADLQTKLQEQDLDVQIVSFSVDPDYDRPEVLKEYAQSYDADLSNWSFLTGYPFETIKKLSSDSFQTVLQEGSPDNPNDLIAHGTSFFLINPDGELVKKYDGMGQDEAKDVISDLEKVL